MHVHRELLQEKNTAACRPSSTNRLQDLTKGISQHSNSSPLRSKASSTRVLVIELHRTSTNPILVVADAAFPQLINRFLIKHNMLPVVR